MLHLSRDLARIRCDVPIAVELDICPWCYDRDVVHRKFEELEFGGLTKLFA
ncbi:hypothetical protein SAMN04487969_1425 [Paenibacillus algorifonticola]|uniref:Uncharacterized protein n=1 Tax=Paenibacillus algorifonticola TaxID=684063 RepID=A0A1I2IXG2_9BACL|nr:hypothetical protein SAMN04487969_1425 [Paenibacillus algorifonticola]